MISRRIVSFVVILLLAGSTFAFAQDASRPAHRFSVRHHPARQRVARVVTAPAPGIVPHSVYEREGLSRDPNACIIWGCIGNN